MSRFPNSLWGKGLGVVDLPAYYDAWSDAAVSGSLLVADPGPYREVVPALRRSTFHDEMVDRGQDGLRFIAGRDEPPGLVVRRVGHQARVETFDGQPQSGLLPVEDAIRALREALRREEVRTAVRG